ncbi:MAG: hypothetical protein WD512_02205, partial [Candidatus Paceibacterota bacterium]
YDYIRELYNTQSALQNESAQENAKLYAPQLREQLSENQAAVIAQTNPSRALKVVIEGWKGNMIEDNKEIVKVGEPLMSQRGISRISSMLIPFISDPIRFGNLERKEVREIALQTVNDITQDIGLNWREYGIKEPTTRDIIIDSCLALILITLTRSEEQGEKNWLSKITLENVSGQSKLNPRREKSWADKYLKL